MDFGNTKEKRYSLEILEFENRQVNGDEIGVKVLMGREVLFAKSYVVSDTAKPHLQDDFIDRKKRDLLEDVFDMVIRNYPQSLGDAIVSRKLQPNKGIQLRSLSEKQPVAIKTRQPLSKKQ